MRPAFEERPTALLVPDAYRFAAPPLVCAAVVGFLVTAPLGPALALALAGLGVFVVSFFRNPERQIPPGEAHVVAPADGRVILVEEAEDDQGRKGLRIAIFLSVFNVHVNRVPVAGRVTAIRRGGEHYFAAFRPKALHHNVHLTMELKTASGAPVAVTQITGWIARRIVCHPAVGDWVGRGQRYGLIRFGSRTDVWLPEGSRARVSPGDRVRGGASVVAELAGGA